MSSQGTVPWLIQDIAWWIMARMKPMIA